MLDALMSTLLQCTIFVGLPWICYLIFNKKREGFSTWIGLYAPKNKNWIKGAIIIFIIATVIMVGPIIIYEKLGYITNDMLYSKELSGQGISFNMIIIILMKAIFQTAFAEEVLFRGFIGKRIAKRFGYLFGNLTQGVLFGIPHGIFFILVYDNYIVGMTFIITATIVGCLQFYLNEKMANGSIVPSLVIHMTMNIISFSSKVLGV